MYAAYYLYTPEVIPTAVRASCVSWLSVLSRLSGMLAPALAGLLLTAEEDAILVILSVVCIALVSLSAAMLPIETQGRALA